ncbi:MAG: hypothetical protein JWR69_351 [Pedosphaera sp.]|nr:hypothetical protein [Pedosphaera sp.]
MKKMIKSSVLMVALAVGASVPAGAQPSTPTTNDTSGTNMWMQHRQQMKAMRQQLKADIKAQDDELQQLVTQMNSAPADQKVDAIAAVVSKLVEDRLATHQEMEAMHTNGMGGHMHMGGTNSATGQGMGGSPK